jgi:tRNA(Ile)-lysidine synthase
MAIPCEVIPIHIPISPRKSIEACARDARYNAITQLLASGEIVLTAHHADDQAETVLLQLLRGAGVAGLAAMPHISPLGKGWLARPLLNYTRTQLHDYAKQVGLQWIEDNSNADTRFDRNFLRHEIIPRLYQRWPALSHVISRVANHQAQANELIHALAEEDWHTCVVDKQLYLPALSCLTPARQRNVLRLWLGKLNLPPPSAIHIQHILNDMLTARTDRQPLVRWRGGEVRRYHDRLFAMSNLPAVPGSLTLTWSLSSPLSLPLGQLAANTVQGRGLIVSPGTILQVRFRQGGERFFWRGHWRAVKKLLQDIHLLPWQRPFLPLIYQKNVLIAIPGIGICDNYTAKQEEIGWEIQWQKTR